MINAVLLGAGVPLFVGLENRQIELERTSALAAQGITHMTFNVKRAQT